MNKSMAFRPVKILDRSMSHWTLSSSQRSALKQIVTMYPVCLPVCLSYVDDVLSRRVGTGLGSLKGDWGRFGVPGDLIGPDAPGESFLGEFILLAFDSVRYVSSHFSGGRSQRKFARKPSCEEEQGRKFIR